MYVCMYVCMCVCVCVSVCVCVFTVKHLWDERPSDWPLHIPFKDPNNAVKDGKYITCSWLLLG